MRGLGDKTDKAYQYGYQPDVDKDEMIPIEFFVMHGLGSTCPIEDQCGTNFRADVFSHYTSMALIIHHGLVHWVSTGVFSIVAVGNWQRSVTVDQLIDDPFPSISPVDIYDSMQFDSIIDSPRPLNLHQFPEEVASRRKKKV